MLHLQRHLLQVNFLESWPIPLSKVSQTEAVVVFQIIVIIGKNYHLDSVQSPPQPPQILLVCDLVRSSLGTRARLPVPEWDLDRRYFGGDPLGNQI